MTAAKIIPFNVNEHCSWILSQNSPHNCIITVRIEGDVDIERLKVAIKDASINQPQLQYAISSDICGFISTNNPISVHEIDLDVDWRRIAENELAKSFLNYDVLARITVLKMDAAQYIILCFHHIIGDGSSGIDYLLQIMHFYNHPNSLKAAELQDEIKELTQPIPEPRVLALQACLTVAKTKIKGIHITNDLINNAENKAKIEGCTLNGYLSTLIFESASQAFNTGEFNVSMSVDLRRKNSSRTIRSLKFHTSWIDFVWQKNDTLKTIHSKIRDKFRNKQQIKNLMDLNEIVNQRGNNADFAKLFIASQPTICIGNNSKVSNSDNENSALKLTELHSSVNCQAYIGTRYSCTMQLCQLSQQGLSINVNYVDTLTDEKEINFFISCLEEKLRR